MPAPSVILSPHPQAHSDISQQVVFAAFLNTLHVLNDTSLLLFLTHRRGLRILMRTDRQDTYSPSPGPNSPAAAPPVTIKQEVVHKPVAVKIEVTGPPEVRVIRQI